MVTQVRPGRGGFLRPFGAAWFIVEFLKGNGPVGSAKIDPEAGAPQQDIHASYKLALHMAIAEDMVAWEQEERVSQGLPVFAPQEWEERKARYLERVPSKLTKMRYHSFLVYFGLLKRLGWVEQTGEVEDSEAQEKMALKPEEGTREGITQNMLDTIQSLLDESQKAESLKRLEAALSKLTPAQRQTIEGLEELMQSIKDYKAVSRKGLTPEEYQEEKESAWSEIEDALTNLSIEEEVGPKPQRQTGQPRIYYRLTDKGRRASSVDISDPIITLYGYTRGQRSGKRKKYYIPRGRGR